MRKFFTIILAAVAVVATAENRRLLTMEEAILSRELIPANYSVVWSEAYPNHYLHKSKSGWSAIDIRTGKEQSVHSHGESFPRMPWKNWRKVSASMGSYNPYLYAGWVPATN